MQSGGSLHHLKPYRPGLNTSHVANLESPSWPMPLAIPVLYTETQYTLYTHREVRQCAC